MNTSTARLHPLLQVPRAALHRSTLWRPMLVLALLAPAMLVWFVLTLQQSVLRGQSLREDWRVADAAEVARVEHTRSVASRP